MSTLDSRLGPDFELNAHAPYGWKSQSTIITYNDGMVTFHWGQLQVHNFVVREAETILREVYAIQLTPDSLAVDYFWYLYQVVAALAAEVVDPFQGVDFMDPL